MNRAKRYSANAAAILATLTFGAGLYLGAVAVKPEIRTVVQSPNHVAASMSIQPGSIQTAEDFNRHVSRVCPNAALPTYQAGEMVPQSHMLRCITHASLYGSNNREGQTPAATPQPYSLHPGRTPLVDPTQDAYYKKLLKEGRFPTSGSAAGRPEWTDYDLPVGSAIQIRHRHADGRDGVGPGQYCQRDRPDHETRP